MCLTLFSMNCKGAGAFELRPRSTKKPQFLAMVKWLGLLARPKKKLTPRIGLPWLKVALMRGELGPRPLYGPDFYGAYVSDLDGNKMNFVYLGEGQK